MKAKKVIKTVLTVILVAVLLVAGYVGFQYWRITRMMAADTQKLQGVIDSLSENGEAFADMFKVVDYEGNEMGKELFEQADLTVVNIWATDCVPCVEETPELNEIAKEYKDKGVQIVGLCGGSLGIPYALQDEAKQAEIKQQAEEILEASGVDSLIEVFAAKEFGDAVEKLIVTGYPTTVFVNGSGEVVRVVSGAYPKSTWIDYIEKTLAEVK